MKALEVIAKATAGLGYRRDAVRKDYLYSDVWGSEAIPRSVPFAAFTQTPPSYRSAAFAAISGGHRDPADLVNEHRALGAPLLFVIEGPEVSTWQVYANGPPRLLGRTPLKRLAAYFRSHKSMWAPDVIHRAKSFGKIDESYQLDFVDVGLVTAIEGEIHKKLDRLLQDALSDTLELKDELQVRYLFRGVFRLLAAKILMDRRHERAGYWDNADVDSVLSAMGDYYQLGSGKQAWPADVITLLQPVWRSLCRGLNVANISADDLAFVYEHTLVTPKARKEFGTHSTPRHVADYIVSRLRLWEHGSSPPQIFEPFTGAGVFLVSALRHLKDGLPHNWSDKKRHNLLVRHIRGAEIDPFACEVAKLSLILADYPNANGWAIDEANLFKGNALSRRMKSADIILCNPPFESFTDEERLAWPEAASLTPSKAIFALETALRAKPNALGFVVPRALLVDRRYRDQRADLEKSYHEIELVSLPDGVFNVSQVDTALLIARDTKNIKQQTIRSSEVFDADKKRFAITGLPSRTREEKRLRPTHTAGSIWLTPLSNLWKDLSDRPRLGSVLEGHWGLRWKSQQGLRSRTNPKAGWAKGLLNTFDHRQYLLGQAVWLDARPEEIYGGENLPWDSPKILCNAGRKGRKYWRLAAAVDRSGLLTSQQFIALWPREDTPSIDLDAIVALLNGPLINAYVSEHSFDKRFRIQTLLSAPLPRQIPIELGKLSREYARAVTSRSRTGEYLRALLSRIDALALSAYELSDTAERDLLDAFQGSERPVAFNQDAEDLLTLGQQSLDFDAPTKERLLFDYFGSVERAVGSGIGRRIGKSNGLAALSEYAQSVPVDTWAGETARPGDLLRLFGIRGSELAGWRRAGSVVALRQDDRSLTYPLEQFERGTPLPGIKDVIETVGDTRSAWLWLRQPHEALSQRTPLDALRRGRIGDVVEVAKRDFD